MSNRDEDGRLREGHRIDWRLVLGSGPYFVAATVFTPFGVWQLLRGAVFRGCSFILLGLVCWVAFSLSRRRKRDTKP
jgi:hypothetical protein